ncbi:hypothetical protein [Jiella sonneratiae]|uniref:DUF1127 domain-containing protein n=1 Tax=Jiella sonneratiae TaxID=2816856 RepID=A0ABS3IYZ0_9HYPH|nr:hypothetical protein [Jiella sonneratiae]MBO0902047.1 hypothetical protein [Jiella sonneratiae]
MTTIHARFASRDRSGRTPAASWNGGAGVRTALATAFRRLIEGLFARSAAARGRSRMRRDIVSLGPDQLRDVGLTRDEALRAADRIRWRSDWS